LRSSWSPPRRASDELRLRLSSSCATAFAGSAAGKSKPAVCHLPSTAALNRETASVAATPSRRPTVSDLSLTFDSESRTLPRLWQKQFDRTVASMGRPAQNRIGHKARVRGRRRRHRGSDIRTDPSGLRYYLFLNCAIGESDSFACMSLSQPGSLDDIERILKSIRFKRSKPGYGMRPQMTPDGRR